MSAPPTFNRQDSLATMDDQSLHDAFLRVTGNADSLTFKQFEHICLNTLQIDLSDTELKRVFDKVDEQGVGSIDFTSFTYAIENRVFFRSLISIAKNRVEFKVNNDYKYELSTNDNYCNKQDINKPINEKSFYGRFASVRRTRDYDYHVNYTKERQEWQDMAVQSVVLRSAPQPAPWIVYTCGPMGAGKGFALSWMSRNGFFPLEDIVHIDPDYFKRVMPEWNAYVERDGVNAGSKCHRESGYIQEIAQEVALERYQNIWVDGSLRDGEWYSTVFADIRNRYPEYRIAIFYVYASEQIVRNRIKERAEITGRSIPEELIKSSLVAPDRSLNILTPLADFVARISNEGTPILEAFETIDHSHNWVVIQQKFARTQADPKEFPNNLAPFYLANTGLTKEHIIINSDEYKKLYDFSYRGIIETKLSGIDISHLLMTSKEFKLYVEKYGIFNYNKLITIINNKQCYMSPCHPVNLDVSSAKAANIPLDVHFFCWVYPITITDDELHDIGVVYRSDLPDVSVLSFLFRGGFAYFSQNGTLLQINTITSNRKSNLLQFGNYTLIKSSVVTELTKQNRWKRTTLSYVQMKGALYYAWILPGENIGGQSFEMYGGFAYLFHEPNDVVDESKNRYFPVTLL